MLIRFKLGSALLWHDRHIEACQRPTSSKTNFSFRYSPAPPTFNVGGREKAHKKKPPTLKSGWGGVGAAKEAYKKLKLVFELVER